MPQMNQALDVPPSSQKRVPTPIQTAISTTTTKDDMPNTDSPGSSSAKGCPSGEASDYHLTCHGGKYRANPFDEIIPDPDEVHHRNLVLCFDGTGDQFEADVSIYSLVYGYEQPTLRGWVELEYRKVLLVAQKERQTSTNGLLSGKTV